MSVLFISVLVDIFMIVISPNYSDGGGTVNVRKLLKSLRSLVSPSERLIFVSRISTTFELDSDVEVININLSKFSPVSLFSLFILLFRIGDQDRKVLICNGRGGCFYGLLLLPFFRKVVFIPRGFQRYIRIDFLMGKFASLFAQQIRYVVVSESEARSVRSVVGSKTRIDVIRNPVQTSCCIPNIGLNVPVVWVGRHSYEKRPNDLEIFLDGYEGTEALHVFVFNPPFDFLKNRSNVLLYKNQSFVNVWKSQRGIFLSFSEREGFPTAVAEAICFGLIPVLTRIPPHLEAISFALTFKVGDVRRCLEISRRVEKLILASRQKTLIRLIRLNKSHFSNDLYFQSWEAIMRDLQQVVI